jgi:hypothetical protein
VQFFAINPHIFIATRICVNQIGALNTNSSIMKSFDFGKDAEKLYAGSILDLSIS